MFSLLFQPPDIKKHNVANGFLSYPASKARKTSFRECFPAVYAFCGSCGPTRRDACQGGGWSCKHLKKHNTDKHIYNIRFFEIRKHTKQDTYLQNTVSRALDAETIGKTFTT